MADGLELHSLDATAFDAQAELEPSRNTRPASALPSYHPSISHHQAAICTALHALSLSRAAPNYPTMPNYPMTTAALALDGPGDHVWMALSALSGRTPSAIWVPFYGVWEILKNKARREASGGNFACFTTQLLLLLLLLSPLLGLLQPVLFVFCNVRLLGRCEIL